MGQVAPGSLSDRNPGESGSNGGMFTRLVAQSQAETDTFRDEITVPTAQVVCIHKVQVSAQADGLISDLLADEGSVVKQGDPLLTIDSRVATAELAVAEKEKESAEKTAEQTANVDYAKAAAEVSREEYEAERELWQKGATTYSVLKRKRLEAERAIYGVDVAEVEHENNGLAADVAAEKVRAAKVRLELYQVLAPYDGVIVQRLRDRGEWTRAGDPIMRLVSMNEMKVEAFVSVEDIQARGVSISQLENAPMQVEVTLVQGERNSRPYQQNTTVDFVSPEIDSGLVRISGKIPNIRLGEGPWMLRDGMTATVRIQLQ
jgi:multidrug efflux pump subunit AcrA (membrane-fusion protein)